MSTKPFEANVRHKDEVAIIDLQGEINALADEALNTAYTQAITRDAKTVLLNFSNVDYINSTGIALIVGLLAQARKSGRRMLTCGLSDHYVEIFKITRLADFMTIFRDEASAIQGVKSQA